MGTEGTTILDFAKRVGIPIRRWVLKQIPYGKEYYRHLEPPVATVNIYAYNIGDVIYWENIPIAYICLKETGERWVEIFSGIEQAHEYINTRES